MAMAMAMAELAELAELVEYTAARRPMRNHNAPGRKQLPPIPERRLSSPKRARGAASRGAGARGLGRKSEDICAGSSVPPSPESRTSAPPGIASAAESRDDDEDIPLVTASLSNITGGGDRFGSARPADNAMLLPAPSPAAAAAVEQHTKLTVVAKDRAEAFLRAATAIASAKAKDDPRVQREAADGRSNSSNSNSSSNDHPELLSIPSDEIEKRLSESAYASEEGQYPRASRNQYQLGILQARLNRRRELPNLVANKEESPNYKTLRSSRIKARAYTNRTINHPNTNDNEPETRGPATNSKSISVANNTSSTPSLTHDRTASFHSVANNTSSTIPSLRKGKNLCPSQTSSLSLPQSFSHHSAAQSGSHNSGAASAGSPELSEYRSKVFAKMLRMFNDVSPNKETPPDDGTISNVKEMVIDEGRASCCSVTELKLIQKLTEEEMSRILYEFEQNNSLIERKETAASNSTPDVKTSESESRANMRRGKVSDKRAIPAFAMPEKIAYNHDTGQSITSKFSDVTSPTCQSHDSSNSVNHPMFLPPAGAHSLRGHQKKKPPPLPLPPSLSPAAAAAAAVAASLSAAGSLNKNLACVLETPATVELNEDNDNAEKIQPKGNAKNMFKAKDYAQDLSKPLFLVEEVGTPETVNRKSIQEDIDELSDGPGGENGYGKKDKVPASNQEKVRRTRTDNNGILNGVAKAAVTADSVKLGEHDAELHEVTAILSQYEEASKKAKEGRNDLKESVEATLITEEPLPPKKIAFLEALTPTNDGSSNDTLCGCAIQ